MSHHIDNGGIQRHAKHVIKNNDFRTIPTLFFLIYENNLH